MATIPGKPVTLAYAGRRPITGGKTGFAFYLLNDNKSLGEKLIYAKVKARLLVGGMYEGANFDAATRTTYGLDSVSWKGPYPDKTEVAAWQAQDHEHMQTVAAAKAQEKYRDGLVEALLPLRRTMKALQKRGQHHEAYAYREMVMAELFRPVTKEEQEADE